MKDHERDRPIDTRFVKVLEKRIEGTKIEEARLSIKYNTVSLFDNMLANVLSPSDEFAFYTIDDLDFTYRKPKRYDPELPTALMAGSTLYSIKVEMSNLAGFYQR